MSKATKIIFPSDQKKSSGGNIDLSNRLSRSMDRFVERLTGNTGSDWQFCSVLRASSNICRSLLARSTHNRTHWDGSPPAPTWRNRQRRNSDEVPLCLRLMWRSLLSLTMGVFYSKRSQEPHPSQLVAGLWAVGSNKNTKFSYIRTPTILILPKISPKTHTHFSGLQKMSSNWQIVCSGC